MYLNYDEVARKFAHSRSRMLKVEVESDSSRACNAMLRGQTNETMDAVESIITRRSRERIIVLERIYQSFKTLSKSSLHH